MYNTLHMTRQQKYAAICLWPAIELHKDEVSIEFELRVKYY